MRRTLNFWRGLMLLLTACIFIACQATPAQHIERHVANEDSRLLSALVQESDFTSDLVWDNKSTRQNSESPTPDNHRLIESAMSSYAGIYGLNRAAVSVDHILKRYEQQAPTLALNEVKPERPATVEVLKLLFPPVGEELASECTRNRNKNATGVMTCIIEVKYPSLLSFLIISAPNDMDVQEFQKFIEQALLGTDARIKAIDQ